MYCTLSGSASLVFASQGTVAPLAAAPELNRALQTLSAQPPGAPDLQDKIDHLRGVLNTHAVAIGSNVSRYTKQLAAADPVEVSDAVHRLAYDLKALVTLRDKEGDSLLAALASEVPELDPAVRETLDAGLRGATTQEAKSPANALQDLLSGASRLLGSEAPVIPAKWDADIVNTICRAMPANDGPPEMSSLAALAMTYQFISNGLNVVKAMKASNNDRELYARQVQHLSFQVLKQLEASLVILHSERLRNLVDSVQSGRKVVFVCNHRSYLDTLVLLLIFGGFRLGFVAKKELLAWPLLNQLIIRGPHKTIDTNSGRKAIKDVTAHTLQMHSEGGAVMVFPEQTRCPTIRRDEEFGLQPFKSGTFRGTQSSVEHGFAPLIQPVFLYGTGLVLPKGTVEGVSGKEGGLISGLRKGVLRHQPLVVDIQQAVDATQISAEIGTGPALARRLTAATHYQMWHEGAPLQAEMNRRNAA